jgi:hypothetical protein
MYQIHGHMRTLFPVLPKRGIMWTGYAVPGGTFRENLRRKRGDKNLGSKLSWKRNLISQSLTNTTSSSGSARYAYNRFRKRVRAEKQKPWFLSPCPFDSSGRACNAEPTGNQSYHQVCERANGIYATNRQCQQGKLISGNGGIENTKMDSSMMRNAPQGRCCVT